MSVRHWTRAEEDKLCRLFDGGASLSRIAVIFGTTRGVVSGKIHRLRKKHLRDASVPVPETSGKVKSLIPVPGNVPVCAPKKKVVPVARTEPLPPPPPVPEPDGFAPVSILSVHDGQCRWPVGEPEDKDFHLCGAPAMPGKPYCPFHQAKAHQVEKSKVRRPRETGINQKIYDILNGGRF